MSSTLKTTLVILGTLSTILIVSQLVLGLLIVNGADAKLVKTHQHSGYLTVTVALIYILFSLAKLISLPTKPKASN
jgi:hypothetical protein